MRLWLWLRVLLHILSLRISMRPELWARMLCHSSTVDRHCIAPKTHLALTPYWKPFCKVVRSTGASTTCADEMFSVERAVQLYVIVS